MSCEGASYSGTIRSINYEERLVPIYLFFFNNGYQKREQSYVNPEAAILIMETLSALQNTKSQY